MTGYEKTIIQATGCTKKEVAEVEDIMRNDIFHSTLDWQSLELFRCGAREAFALLREIQKPNS